MGYILAVALITWGGVFAYLVRLEIMTRQVEKLAADTAVGGSVSTEL